jgi:hypothetical protein
MLTNVMVDESRSAEVAPSVRAVAPPHRVIGRDGVERNIVGPAEWIAAVRSNTVDDACLFFDPESQRWRPLRELGMYCSAVATADGPNDLSAAMKGSATETLVRQGSEARPSLLGLSGLLTRSAAVWWFVVVVGSLAVLTWATGPGLQFVVHLVPLPALIAGLVLVLISLGEEFHWFALRLVGLTTTRLGERLCVQVGALLTTALISYLALGQISLTAPEATLLSFVRNAVAIGGIYALAMFLWSLPLIALSFSAPGKKALASLLAAAMLIGTFYMALAPSARQIKPTESTRIQSEQRP